MAQLWEPNASVTTIGYNPAVTDTASAPNWGITYEGARFPGANETGDALNHQISAFYDKTFLERLLPDLFWDRFATHRSQPRNNTETFIMRRYNPIVPADGHDPSSLDNILPETATNINQQSANTTDIEDRIYEVGSWMNVTSRVNLLDIDPVLTEVTTLMGEHAQITLDSIWRDMIFIKTNTHLGLSGTAENPTTTAGVIDWSTFGTTVPITDGEATPSNVATRAPNQADFRAAALAFRLYGARPDTTMILPTTKYNTRAIRPSYWVVTTPEMADYLEYNLGTDLAPVVPRELYSDPTKAAYEEEVFAWNGFRFMTNNHSRYFTGTAGNEVIHPIIIMSGKPYGIISLRGFEPGKGRKIIDYIPPKKQQTDRYGHEGFLVWNTWTGLTVAVQERIRILYGVIPS